MMRRNLKTNLLTIMLLALGTAELHAAQIDLQLSGAVRQLNVSSQNVGSTRFDIFDLPLTGLPGPLTLNVLDTITATITLDQSLTIPPSVFATVFAFLLQGDFGTGPSITSGTVALSNLGVAGAIGNSPRTTSGSVISSLAFGPPDNVAITFDMVVSSFTIEALSQSGDATSARLGFILLGPVAVPEPPAVLFVAIGLGLLSAARLRRALPRNS